MVDKISRLSHEVDTAREDFKVFLNELQRKGTKDFCILSEAVNIFEICKIEVQKLVQTKI